MNTPKPIPRYYMTEATRRALIEHSETLRKEAPLRREFFKLMRQAQRKTP